MRVLALSGSLRRDSYNTQLLRAAEELGPAGVRLELYEGLADIPPFDEDEQDEPVAAVTRFRSALDAADALLVATPEYNSSIPGQLKNALDWASRPFHDNPLRGKPVAVIGASTGAYGALWAQAELRKVLGTIGARVLPDGVALAYAQDGFDGSGRLADDEVAAQLVALLDRLVAEVPALVAA
jgi:chromate reductase, NAD(P)H dehydrogenase (quinone)